MAAVKILKKETGCVWMEWNKKLKRKIFLLGLIGFVLFVWTDACLCALYMKERYTCLSVRYKEEGVSLSSLEEAYHNEKEKEDSYLTGITAWNRIPRGELLNPVLNRSAEIPVIKVWKDVRQSAPLELLKGNYFWEEDARGCLLDSVSAYELFGTIDVIGNSLIYEEIEYTIRGVVKSQSQGLWIPDLKKNTEFLNLELTFSDMENAQMYGENFLYQYQLGASWVFANGALYSKVIYHFLLIPPWLCGGFIILWWKKEKMENLRGRMIFVPASIALLAGCYFIIGNPLYFPRQWIPVKWSDFGYWKLLFEEIKHNLAEIRYLVPSPKDVFLLDRGKLCLMEGSVVLLFIPIIRGYIGSCGIDKNASKENR